MIDAIAQFEKMEAELSSNIQRIELLEKDLADSRSRWSTEEEGTGMEDERNRDEKSEQ